MGEQDSIVDVHATYDLCLARPVAIDSIKHVARKWVDVLVNSLN